MTASEDSAATARLQTWSRARDVFDDLVALPAHERAAALDARCGDDATLRRFVEALLAADAQMPDTRDDPMIRDIGRSLSRLAAGIARGRRFGAFAVVEEIGRGGMGVVYLAERHDGAVAQRVALKLVASGHLDADASARFARERRVLATLEHPNIARLIDAGEDPSGIPYFAMEYVNGLPITRWCDERKLPLADRLRLFRQVCSAVQYAHANLVVHCDIKAGNILVTDGGLPKLLDFGIATTLGIEAGTGENRFLSPHSAAPEQFLRQPTGVAADVYALGVLLCELTGGRPPFDGDAETLRERVLHDAPRLPSAAAPALRRRLRGDIDAIAAKALNKAPHDRYASVEQFDADIERHLATRPIAVRAGERGYRARTFVRRNVLPVSLAAVLALLAAGFATTTLRQNQRLAHERDQAQIERARSQQVTDFVVGLFRAARPEETRGREVTARQLLERGRQQLNGTLAQQPQVKAAMLTAIAEASYSLDDLQGSYRAARESLELLDGLASPPPRDLAATLGMLARLESEFGRNDEALGFGERAFALADIMDSAWRADLALDRAVTRFALVRGEEGRDILRAALAERERTVGRRDVRTMRLAAKLAQRSSDDEGLRILDEYLPDSAAVDMAGDAQYGDVLDSLSIFWRRKGDFDRAVDHAEKATAFYTRIYGDDSSPVARAKNTWATALAERGDNERAMELFEQSATTLRRVHGETENLARIEHNVGSILAQLKRYDEALPYLQRAAAIGAKVVAPRSNTLAFFRRRLGWVLCELGRWDEGERELKLAVATFEANGSRSVNRVVARALLDCVALRRGQTAVRDGIALALSYLDQEKTDATQRDFLRRCIAGSM